MREVMVFPMQPKAPAVWVSSLALVSASILIRFSWIKIGLTLERKSVRASGALTSWSDLLGSGGALRPRRDSLILLGMPTRQFIS